MLHNLLVCFFHPLHCSVVKSSSFPRNTEILLSKGWISPLWISASANLKSFFKSGKNTSKSSGCSKNSGGVPPKLITSFLNSSSPSKWYFFSSGLFIWGALLPEKKTWTVIEDTCYISLQLEIKRTFCYIYEYLVSIEF